MLGLIGTAAAAAYRQYEWLPTTGLIAVLGVVAGALWFVMEDRRVGRIEAQWATTHQPGGAKNSSAMPSGSRKLRPDP